MDLNEKFNLAEIKFDFFKSGKAKEMEAQRELREKELIQQHESELQSFQSSLKKAEHELGQMEA